MVKVIMTTSTAIIEKVVQRKDLKVTIEWLKSFDEKGSISFITL